MGGEHFLFHDYGDDKRTLKPTSLELELHQPNFQLYYELVNRQHHLAKV